MPCVPGAKNPLLKPDEENPEALSRAIEFCP